MKISKKGISLIVLVITIIVIIILAGAVILNLASNNPIDQARKAAFLANVDAYSSQLVNAVANEVILNPTFDVTTFDKSIWTGGDTTGTIKESIPIITSEDAVKFEIRDGKLVYVGTDQAEKDWLATIGIANGSVTPP